MLIDEYELYHSRGEVTLPHVRVGKVQQGMCADTLSLLQTRVPLNLVLLLQTPF